jgi:putative transposase
MSRFSKLSHTIYECKYHIVFCPKYRYRILQGDIAEYCKSQIYFLCSQKDKIEILELNIQLDHFI